MGVEFVGGTRVRVVVVEGAVIHRQPKGGSELYPPGGADLRVVVEAGSETGSGGRADFAIGGNRPAWAGTPGYTAKTDLAVQSRTGRTGQAGGRQNCSGGITPCGAVT